MLNMAIFIATLGTFVAIPLGIFAYKFHYNPAFLKLESKNEKI